MDNLFQIEETMHAILIKLMHRTSLMLALLLYASIGWANPVSVENTKAGSTGWMLRNPARKGEIEGYASLTSVNRGASITLYVNTAVTSYSIDIYRMGYYGGAGARLMLSLPARSGKVQPTPCPEVAGALECNWQASAKITIPADIRDVAAAGYWASGVYLAKLTMDSGSVNDSYILFVVRDDARVSDYVAQLPVTTYQAYNFWGGRSLYTGCAVHNMQWGCANGAQRAHRVSFNRPYVPSSNPAAAYGAGAGEFITNVQPVVEGYPITSAGFDYNMVRWMERQGYDVKYTTDIDLHQDRARLANARALVAMGHDEYYSLVMWDNLNALQQRGTNLAFFTSNEIYWRIRFENASVGPSPSDRTMVVYKDGDDPVTAPALTTGKFRDLGTPEAALVGVQYVTDPVQGDIHVSNPAHWLFNATGATSQTVLRGLLGYEIDGVVPDVSPSGTVVLAHSPAGDKYGDASYYIAPSSAQVFASGSMQWAWGLDSFISNNTRTDYTSAIAQKITANVFAAFRERDLTSFVNDASALSMSASAQGDAPVVQTVASTGLDKQDAWRVLVDAAGKYRIVSRASGLCLDAYGAVAGAAVRTLPCNGTAQQNWALVERGGGALALSDAGSGLCLNNPGGSTPGARLTLASCTADPRQQWRRLAWRSGTVTPPAPPIGAGSTLTMAPESAALMAAVTSVEAAAVVLKPSGASSPSTTLQWNTVASGDGAHLRLVSVSNHLCLDAYGVADGAPAGTWACHGGANQDWQLRLLSGDIYQISNRSTAQCLAYPSAPASDAPLTMAACGALANQRWRLATVSAPAGVVAALQNKHSGLYAGIADPASPGALRQRAAGAVWTLAPAIDARYTRLMLGATGLCADAYGATALAQVGTWACHDGDNQQWLQLTAPVGVAQWQDRRSGLCLAVADAALTVEANLVLAPCAAVDAQLWRQSAP